MKWESCGDYKRTQQGVPDVLLSYFFLFNNLLHRVWGQIVVAML